jgi:hypothetical protein
MYISPPITVLAILAAMVAGTLWLAPPQREVAQVTAILPTATYQRLALWGKEHPGADGRALNVVQVIEKFSNKWRNMMRSPRIIREWAQDDRHLYPTQRGAQMKRTDQSGHREVRRAMKDLRTRTASNLRAFNDAVPHASWLRRSEIEGLTFDLLWAAERAPQRREPTPLGMIKNALSWIARVRTATRFS